MSINIAKIKYIQFNINYQLVLLHDEELEFFKHFSKIWSCLGIMCPASRHQIYQLKKLLN